MYVVCLESKGSQSNGGECCRTLGHCSSAVLLSTVIQLMSASRVDQRVECCLRHYARPLWMLRSRFASASLSRPLWMSRSRFAAYVTCETTVEGVMKTSAVRRRLSTTDVFYWSTSTTNVFDWSTSTTNVFYLSTSTRLTFSTGRHRPD